MKSRLSRWCGCSLALTLLLFAQAIISPQAAAQGGEPQYFAIRRKQSPSVSGPAMEDATVVVARGVILAVGGKDVPIPATHS